MLLPVLAKAKGQARRIQCIDNERQMAITWVLYAGDNADALVPNGQTAPGGTVNPKLWIQGVFYYTPDSTNTALMLDSKYALFAPYLHSLEVYRCPTDRLSVMVSGRPYPKIRSYSLNAYTGWLGQWDGRLAPLSIYRVFHKSSEILSPSAIFTFQDVFADSICWPYFGVTMNQDSFFNFPAVSHNSGGVAGFADGHVEGHRWRDARTLAAQSRDYHSHDDPSPGNADLAWLRAHATVRGQ
jgi:prepilin-type processing-associated H-X9-DG protein